MSTNVTLSSPLYNSYSRYSNTVWVKKYIYACWVRLVKLLRFYIVRFVLLFCLPFVVNKDVQKIPPALQFSDILFKRLGVFNQFFTHLLRVPIYARLQIFIHLSPILTKLCRIKRDYLVHVISSKWRQSAETHAFRRLRKSLIAFLIVVCGKSL